MNLSRWFRQHGALQDVGGHLPIEIPRATRSDLALWFADLGLTRGAEIGVWQGAYSVELLKANPALHLTCVDPWRVHPQYQDVKKPGTMETSRAAAELALAPFGERVQILRQFSLEAAADVPDGSLDFVYIDGNHRFECAASDLGWWAPKVREGGVVSGHDYAFIDPKHLLHVIWAVNGYTEAYGIKPWYVLGRGRDTRGHQGDSPHKYRSWMWVQPAKKGRRG
jgi:hypothetical protein